MVQHYINLGVALVAALALSLYLEMSADSAAHAAPGIVSGLNGLPKAVASHHSGAVLEVYLHGATVTSFKTSAGQELLFVSSKAIFDGVKPIRGGIPVVFPQFGMNGPLPQHGFARNNQWTVASSGDGFIVLELNDSEATRAAWPHAFHLTYRIQFDDTHLATALEVTNPKTAAEPFSFDALLHTYIYTGDKAVDGIHIHGLKGTKYISKVDGGATLDETGDSIVLDREIDRVYLNTPVDVEVTGIQSGATLPADKRFDAVVVKRVATVRDASGLHGGSVRAPLDVVVWNAHVERCKAIADFGPEDWRSYVCVEPGRVSPATADFPAHKALAPGQQWTLKQELVLKRSA